MSTYQITNYATLATIVQDVCRMVGFPVPTDPAGSSDAAVQQMIAAANMAADDMVSLYDWRKLVKVYEIEVIADYPGQFEKSFDLPGDFWQFIDQTQWNKNTRLPALGPISDQIWQQIKIRMPKVVLTFLWQIRDQKLWIQMPPSDPQMFSFMYMSQGWCKDADDPDMYKNQATKNGDQILFNQYLMKLLTRAKWLEMKGFDSSAAMRDFFVNYENRKGDEQGANVLSMCSSPGLPYINILTNVPDTGYGGVGF